MDPLYVQNCNSPFEVAKIDDEWMILNLHDFSMTKVNQLAGYCWSLLKEAQNLEMLVGNVSNHFVWSDELNTLKDDIKAEIDYLLSEDLIYYVN